MALLNTVVNIELHVTLNGEPVTRYLTMPGQIEHMDAKGKGLTVHLDLDVKQLAKALAPYIARELPAVIRNITDTRSF